MLIAGQWGDNDLIVPVALEFAGTFIFFFIILCVRDCFPQTSTRQKMMASTIICAYLLLLIIIQPLFFAHQNQSGAIFNPALTLTIYLSDHLKNRGNVQSSSTRMIRCLFFIFIQFLGGLLAVLVWSWIPNCGVRQLLEIIQT